MRRWGRPWATGGRRRAGSDVPPLAPAAAKRTGTIAGMWLMDGCAWERGEEGRTAGGSACGLPAGRNVARFADRCES